MASSQTTVDYMLEQMARAGTVSARKMFGEYGVYCDGKVVALICDDQLFIKPTEAGRAVAGPVAEGLPYPGAKPWLLVDGDRLEDAGWLAGLVRVTAEALPLPKPKPVKKPKPAQKTK
jgi:DNA transformation protein and related proteins